MFGTEAVLILSPENLYYFSGFTGGEGALVMTDSSAVLLVDSRYTLQAAEECSCEVRDIAGLHDLLNEYQTIGFEEEYVTVARLQRLQEKTKAEWKGIGQEILKRRAVKTEEEIKKIRLAQEYTDRAFTHILPYLKEGVSEKDIALELEFALRKMGAQGMSFDTIVASGYRSAMPHGEASGKKLEKGDLVVLDFGCKVDGYCSDMTRTVAIGSVTDRQREIYNTVLKAQKAALAALHCGILGCDADAAARSVIKDAGYGNAFGHALGHSLGLEIHEEPRLSPKYDKPIPAGTVITVEPGIYLEGVGGVRIEDLCVIYENYVENLTNSTKELLIL